MDPVFYIDPDHANDSFITFNKVESHHITNVMRLKEGALVVAVDGNGTAYRGEIAKAKKSKPVEVKIHAVVRNFGETDAVVTLAAGISTGTKFETVIEKGTELGIKRFVPLLCDKGKVKIDEPKKVKTKLTRYHKVAMAAMKQCRRSYLPDITAPTTFNEFMKNIDPDANNFIFHPTAKAVNLQNISFTDQSKRFTLIVGPESGFSDNEIDSAILIKIQPVSLGQRILRTETAGPVISAVFMHLLNEFR